MKNEPNIYKICSGRQRFLCVQATVPPEQLEPVDLSVKASVANGSSSCTMIPDDLREEAMRAGLLEGNRKEGGVRSVVLKVPHFQSLALQTLGLDLTLRTGQTMRFVY